MTVEFKRNDILVERYEYENVIYKFYKVVSVKGKTVNFIPLGQTCTWKGLECEVRPVNRKCWLQREVITKRYNKYGFIKGNMDRNLYLYNNNNEYVECHAY